MGSVWPVRGPEGEPWMVKLTDAHHEVTLEGDALAAWSAQPLSRSYVVALLDRATDLDGPQEALLLERLEPDRPLMVEPIERADAALAEVLAALRDTPAPGGVRHTAQELSRIAAAIRAHRAELGAATPVPAQAVDTALATLDELGSDRAVLADRRLCHFDLHYDNVLRDLGDTRWVAIDPLPHAGLPEVEVIAALRNRYADAAATGDPERALRRRFDRLCDAACLDRPLARALAQAVAVDNLLWLLPRQPDSMFVPGYAVLAGWTSPSYLPTTTRPR